MIRFVRNYLPPILIALIMFLWFGSGSPLPSFAQQPEKVVQWAQAMRVPSPEDSSSWFPDLAVDSQDRVHIVWAETKRVGTISPRSGTFLEENLYYSMWNGRQWSQPNDLMFIVPDIVRNAIAVDNYDVLHFLFDWAPESGFDLYYRRAQASSAASAAAWSSPRLVSSRGGVYYSDIAVYENTLHIVYDDVGAAEEDDECFNCADIFYRHSPDRGLTWSAPLALFPTNNIGSARPQIEVDKTGTIYVAWDEGWDRRTDKNDPEKQGVYIYSTDGGNTWSSPLVITYPNVSNYQLTVGSDGEGGVMLVWRTESTDYPGIYAMWSEDYGATWGPPKALPNITSRFTRSQFDMYDMATDSAGQIHLLVVGQLGTSESPIPGLYHFEWDGQTWSDPAALYEGTWHPEYPHLVVHEGNQLHATWFIRQETEPHQIWYAQGQSSAPAVAPEIRPTSTPTLTPAILVTATPSPTPTSPPTPTPTLDPLARDVVVPEGATESIYTDMDDVLLIGLSLVPALIVISMAVIVARGWRRR